MITMVTNHVSKSWEPILQVDPPTTYRFITWFTWKVSSMAQRATPMLFGENHGAPFWEWRSPSTFHYGIYIYIYKIMYVYNDIMS